jgi:hypothetical protein
MYIDDKIPRDCYVMHPTSFQGRRTQKLTIRKFGNLNLTKRNKSKPIWNLCTENQVILKLEAPKDEGHKFSSMLESLIMAH